jgi:hypothetical protein
MQAILLLSDGHSSRTDYDMVMKQLLHHALLIPAITSHALSAGDHVPSSSAP